MINDNKIFQKIGTTASFIGKKSFQFFLWYKAIWVNFTHNKYDEFVYKRGVAMIAASLASVVVAFVLISLVFQVTYYWTTHKKETVYLIQSEQIYPDENIWGVRGCYTEHCVINTSVYFRINPSIFHHLWNLADNGHFFLPDALGASVPTGLTRCEVVSYGIRVRVLMMFNIYPNILKITCEQGLSGNPPGPKVIGK